MMLAISTAWDSVRYTTMNGSERQFPCTLHAALSATMRKGLERTSALTNLSGGAVLSGGIILTNMCNDGGEIFSGLRGPANLHLTNATSARYSLLPLRA